MADFTRFDFHAKKFYFSEDVQVMSAEEVGQYLLLLVAAWLGGKDASLPDNPVLLARAARVTTVSQAVLAKFPIVETEHGPRRRNETLFDEWQSAVSRSTTASQNGQVGGRARTDVKVEAARNNGRSGGRPVLVATPSITQAGASDNPSETQSQSVSVPVQSVPVQSVPLGEREIDGDQVKVAPKPLGGDWKNIAIRHKRIFGKKAGAMFKAKYAEACATYSEDVVLECFDAWAPGNKSWVETNSVDQPLFAFFKKLPEEAADAVDLQNAIAEDDAKAAAARHAAADEKKKQDAVQAASIARQTAEITNLMGSGKPTDEGWGVLDLMNDDEEEDSVRSDNPKPDAGSPAGEPDRVGEAVRDCPPADARGA
jgi:uncharacterized protein YdaU (DUF1376 family)